MHNKKNLVYNFRGRGGGNVAPPPTPLRTPQLATAPNQPMMRKSIWSTVLFMTCSRSWIDSNGTNINELRPRLCWIGAGSFLCWSLIAPTCLSSESSVSVTKLRISSLCTNRNSTLEISITLKFPESTVAEPISIRFMNTHGQLGRFDGLSWLSQEIASCNLAFQYTTARPTCCVHRKQYSATANLFCAWLARYFYWKTCTQSQQSAGCRWVESYHRKLLLLD